MKKGWSWTIWNNVNSAIIVEQVNIRPGTCPHVTVLVRWLLLGSPLLHFTRRVQPTLSECLEKQYWYVYCSRRLLVEMCVTPSRKNSFFERLRTPSGFCQILSWKIEHSNQRFKCMIKSSKSALSLSVSLLFSLSQGLSFTRPTLRLEPRILFFLRLILWISLSGAR